MLLTMLSVAEPSHLPFYIAGGVLALWAVVLSWIGLSRPAFPFGGLGQYAVTGISFILAGATVAMAIVTSK